MFSKAFWLNLAWSIKSGYHYASEARSKAIAGINPNYDHFQAMMMQDFCEKAQLVIVALFCLIFFLAGLLVGRMIYAKETAFEADLIGVGDVQVEEPFGANSSSRSGRDFGAC